MECPFSPEVTTKESFYLKSIQIEVNLIEPLFNVELITTMLND